MPIRAKTSNLIQITELTEKRRENSELNRSEMNSGTIQLQSKPQRIVFELTNACNLNCVMCGRNAADFSPTMFKFNWLEKFYPIMDEIEEVTLMGWGEPTLHPQFVDMLRVLQEKGVRKYFCTNGMLLDKLEDAIFENKVDVFAVSMDGADKETNDRIRHGADFNKVIKSLQSITARKKRENLKWPYINFVFTAMKSNISQLPALVDLAAKIGLDEVKVVYLTVFEPLLLKESLYNETEDVEKYFSEAEKIAEKHGILIKLPHIRGEDSAGKNLHKDCFTAYRDFFLGSDGYIRACMSSSEKLFHVDKYNGFNDMWNSPEYQNWRSSVNHIAEMSDGCKRCYQSSFANWNNKHSFIQIGNDFAPNWDKK